MLRHRLFTSPCILPQFVASYVKLLLKHYTSTGHALDRGRPGVSCARPAARPGPAMDVRQSSLAAAQRRGRRAGRAGLAAAVSALSAPATRSGDVLAGCCCAANGGMGAGFTGDAARQYRVGVTRALAEVAGTGPLCLLTKRPRGGHALARRAGAGRFGKESRTPDMPFSLLSLIILDRIYMIVHDTSLRLQVGSACGHWPLYYLSRRALLYRNHVKSC